MTMDRYAFREKFPALTSAFGAFLDSPSHDDETLARELYGSDPSDIRAGLLAEVLDEGHRFMASMDQNWELLQGEANRRLYTRDEALAWLMRMMTVWQEELTRLRGGNDSPAA